MRSISRFDNVRFTTSRGGRSPRTVTSIPPCPTNSRYFTELELPSLISSTSWLGLKPSALTTT